MSSWNWGEADFSAGATEPLAAMIVYFVPKAKEVLVQITPS